MADGIPAKTTDHEPDFLIDFGTQGNSASYCGEGWSAPEPQERWSVGRASRLEVPVPHDPATYILQVHLRPFVSPGRLSAQRLGVSVNGTRVGDFVVRERTVRACRIPWSAIRGRDPRDRLEIDFHTPDAARPDAVEGGRDSRMLGIAFTSLALYADRHTRAPPPASGVVGGVDIDSIIAAEQISQRELMFQFESLGQNCEFGLVQRRSQAEPLGLLRFASTPLPHLLAALEARFAGLGTPDAFAVEVSANGKEYMISDKRYGLLYHAWVKIGEMAPEDVHRREARRVPILVRKLIEDLQAADKTFIFKGMGAMPEEEVEPLVAAIRRYGPNTLLFVTLADSGHRAGTVEVRAPGFLVGYLDRFAPEEDAHDLLLAPWVRLCRETYRLRLSAACGVPIRA